MKFPKEILKIVSRNLINLRRQIQTRITSIKLQDPFSNPDRLNDNAASDTEASEESTHERMEALEKVLKRNLEERKALKEMELKILALKDQMRLNNFQTAEVVEANICIETTASDYVVTAE